MSAEVRIRPARLDDDTVLLELDRHGWPPGTGFPSFRERVMREESFFSDRNQPEAHLVAERDGEVVGYVRVMLARDIPEARHVYGIFGLVVDPRARRLGAAGALLDAAETYAKRLGGRKMILYVLQTNEPAQRLYQRHGYVVEGRQRAAFLIDGQYVDDITMAKQLR